MSKEVNNQCIDFASMNAGPLPNPSISLNNHIMKFTTNDSLGLEIRPHPIRLNGLQIHSDLTLELVPTCHIVMIHVSSKAFLKWSAFNSNGAIIETIPPSPGSNKLGLSISIIGDVSRIEFEGQNEEEIHSICCYDCQQNG
jgi:hypothetical protein